MSPNFFTKLVRNASAKDGVTNSPYSAGDPDPDASAASLRIGVVPPSPELSPDHHHHHRRVRSQDRERHIPNRHEVSLAARPTSDAVSFFIDDADLTPTARPVPAPDWVATARLRRDPSPRALSPASSTGNLKGFVEMRARPPTQPSPPISDRPVPDTRSLVDVRQRHEERILLESPTSFPAQKAHSQELLSDPDTKSLRSVTSSNRRNVARSRSTSRKASASGPPPTTMSTPPHVPPVPPLPSPVLHPSRSTLSTNAATPKRPADRKRSLPTPAHPRSTTVSLSRSELSDPDTFPSSGEESPSSSDGLDLDDHDIPVTGFAVASSRRNADFHELFPNIPEGDYLIEDYGCALQREILIQGRLYISENHICFHANIFGWITDLSIPIYEITGLEKKMTAFVIPNAIQITTRQAKYTFASFLSRDTTYDVIANIWRLARPDEGLNTDSRNPSIRDVASTMTTISEASGREKENGLPVSTKVTHCACSKSGGHLSELALETVLPGTPDKIYNLMFASGFIKDFMKVDQKLSDVQISDWAPIAQGLNLLQRNMSYIKPLNNSVGPKQTKCEIHDENVFCDFDDHVVMLTSTKTPDVPSGGVFVVKTRTCLMWASAVSTRVIVTTQVDWTGRSFIKGLIEKSAIEGQKVYHADLDKAMRMYIQEHQAEFIPEGLDPSVVAPVEPLTPLAEGAETVVSPQERERERNRRGMQWAYDTLDGAYNVAARSTRGALELVKEAWEQSSSTTILWFVIVLLVMSNVWTLLLVGHREEVGRRKEMRRAEDKERWLQGVVAGVWEELAAERARGSGGVVVPLATVPIGEVHAEIANVGKVLDAVEQRVKAIRETLDGLS